MPGARVLARRDGTLQIGIRDGVVVDGVTEQERRFLERLETCPSVSAADQSRYARVLDRLERAGLLTADAAAGERPLRVQLNDGGPVGNSIGLALARAGWAVAIDDARMAVQAPRGTYDPGSIATTRQAASCDTIRRLLPSADVTGGRADSDVTVIVAHGAPLTEAAVPLMARDEPHLYVTTDERGARVGPLVVPGRSACGTCLGLACSHIDPDWPTLALQLAASRTMPQGSPDVQAHVTGLAVAALGWWRAYRDVEPASDATWCDAVWVVDHQRGPRREPVLPSPDCGCGAAGPVGDELAARRARMR